MDATISSLLASALVWQFGLIDNYSRGISLLYLVSLLVSLALSRPIIRAVLRHMAARGAIEVRRPAAAGTARSHGQSRHGPRVDL